MVCKKCGCDTLIKTEDWYKCANCGAIYFDTDVTVNNITSPTKEMEKMENKKSNKVIKDDAVEDAEVVEVSDKASEKKAKKSKKKDDKEEKKPSAIKEIVDFCLPIVIAIVIAILLKTFVFANCVVPTGSMLNTIQEQDRIIASRLAYINHDPERYDVVLFRFPDDETQIYVKRVIGLPGETVEIKKGIVFVTREDGEVVQLDDSFVTACESIGDFGPYEVPDDSYFMLGDNRANSQDSRYWENKYVHKDKILGKAKYIYYSKNGNTGVVK